MFAGMFTAIIRLGIIFVVLFGVTVLILSPKGYMLPWYILKDFFKALKSNALRIYGVGFYVGDVGSGKTISAIEEIERYRKADPRRGTEHALKIFSNLGLAEEDGKIEKLEDLFNLPSYSVVLLDEVQDLAAARQFKNLPPSFMGALTQNRKLGNTENGKRPPGIRIIMTTQDWLNTDVYIRRLTNKVIACRSFFNGRFIFQKHYRRTEFEKAVGRKKICGAYSFVATDYLRSRYDTYKVLESFRKYERNPDYVLPTSAPVVSQKEPAQ